MAGRLRQAGLAPRQRAVLLWKGGPPAIAGGRGRRCTAGACSRHTSPPAGLQKTTKSRNDQMSGEKETTTSTISISREQFERARRPNERTATGIMYEWPNRTLGDVAEDGKEDSSHCRRQDHTVFRAGAPAWGYRCPAPAFPPPHHRLAGRSECLHPPCRTPSAPSSARASPPGHRPPGAPHHPGLTHPTLSRGVPVGAGPAPPTPCPGGLPRCPQRPQGDEAR